MTTETVQTTQSEQAGKQVSKEEVKGTRGDGSTYEVKREEKVENKAETAGKDPLSRVAQAEAVVRRNVLWALGAGVIPVPIADVVAVTGVQVKMLKELSDLYGVDFKSSIAKKIVYSLLSGIGSVGLGSVVGASLSKLIPGVGTTLGIISIPLFAGAFTHALGHIFLMHFESGGTLLDFDPHAVRTYFRQEFEKAKETVSRMQKEETKTTTAKTG